MRRNRVELEALHAALLAAYRELPDASSTAGIRYASMKAGCSAVVAKRAFEVGLGKGLRSIRDLIDEERLLARSTLRRENVASLVSEATEDARADAVESRKRAGKLVVQRQLALSELLRFLGAHLKEFGERFANEEQVEKMSLPELASTLRSLASTAGELQRQESLILGEPNVILGGEVAVITEAQPQVSLDEVKAEVAAAAKAVALLEANASTEANPDRAVARNGAGPQHQ